VFRLCRQIGEKNGICNCNVVSSVCHAFLRRRKWQQGIHPTRWTRVEGNTTNKRPKKRTWYWKSFRGKKRWKRWYKVCAVAMVLLGLSYSTTSGCYRQHIKAFTIPLECPHSQWMCMHSDEPSLLTACLFVSPRELQFLDVKNMEDRIWRQMLTTKTNSIVGTNYGAGPGFILICIFTDMNSHPSVRCLLTISSLLLNNTDAVSSFIRFASKISQGIKQPVSSLQRHLIWCMNVAICRRFLCPEYCD